MALPIFIYPKSKFLLISLTFKQDLLFFVEKILMNKIKEEISNIKCEEGGMNSGHLWRFRNDNGCAS